MDYPQVIEDFLVSNYPNKITRRLYGYHLLSFFQVIGANPDTYFTEDHNYENDVRRYIVSLIEDNRPPKVIKSAKSVIRVFITDNGIDLPNHLWIRLNRLKIGSRSITADDIPSKEELKIILSHADLKKKALITFLASSGCRIGETCQLVEADIDMTKTPTKVVIPASITKSRNFRYTFISNEATGFLKQWLKVKDDWLLKANKVYQLNPDKPRKDIKDDRIFPFTTTTARKYYNTLLDKAGLGQRDRNTRYRVYHLHTLRKFCFTHLCSVLKPNIVHGLLGHEEYLAEVYGRYSVDELGKLYANAMHVVEIFHSGYAETQIEHLQNEIDRLHKEKNLQNEVITNINVKLSKLARINSLRSRLANAEITEEKEQEDAYDEIARLEEELDSL